MKRIEYDEIVKLSEKLKKYAVEMPLTKHSTEESPIPQPWDFFVVSLLATAS